MNFLEKWLAAVEEKNSVLCAGLDPAEFAMGRGDNGLAEEESKIEWALNYIETVAPYCAAVKFNTQYWKGKGNEENLRLVSDAAHDLGMIVIDDSKLADIGSTNDAGFFYAKDRGADAVTVAPFAGNLEEAIRQGHNYGLGVISMCLMSNPEYEREKNKLVPVSLSPVHSDCFSEDIINADGTPYVKQYIVLANDARKFGGDGIVIGAPSKKNHIKEEEITKARHYAGENVLVLLPGVGAQGGEADAIWKHFDNSKVIVNVGRALMFPKGSNSGPEDWEAAGKHYQNMLNELRE